MMAAEEKTLAERYSDETLTDNTQFDKCQKCKDCMFRDDGTIYSNQYQKGCCAMYPYPEYKPYDVVMNRVFCEYYEKEKTIRK